MWRKTFFDPSTIAFKLFLKTEAVSFFSLNYIQLTLTAACYLFETYLKPILTFIYASILSQTYILFETFHHTPFDPRFINNT